MSLRLVAAQIDGVMKFSSEEKQGQGSTYRGQVVQGLGPRQGDGRQQISYCQTLFHWRSRIFRVWHSGRLNSSERVHLGNHERYFSKMGRGRRTGRWSSKAVHECSCPTLCDPMDCSLPDSSVHEFLQARILEWVAISNSRGSARARD